VRACAWLGPHRPPHAVAQCHLTLATPNNRLVAEVTLDEQEMRDALSSGFRQVRSRAIHVLAFTGSFNQRQCSTSLHFKTSPALQVAGFIFGRNKPAVGNGASETVVGARPSPGMLGPARRQRAGVLRWRDGAWLCLFQAMTSPVVLEERAEDGKKIHKGSGEKIAMCAALPVPHLLQQAPLRGVLPWQPVQCV